MKTLADLKVGDTIWHTDCNFHRGTQLQTAVVEKIGTKIITCAGRRCQKFYKETFRGAEKEYGGHYRMYLEEQPFLDERRIKKLESMILEKFRSYSGTNIPLTTLEQLIVILGLDEKV